MSELKQKIRESLQDPQLVSLATVTKEGRPWVRYVMAFGDEDLTIRFVTGMDSRKVAHIKENPEVHITLGAVSLMETERYMQIAGRAEVTRDETERKRFWKDELKAYFSGPDDPNYGIAIVRPYRIEYMTMTSMTPEIWESP